jgi:hypothetical protein
MQTDWEVKNSLIHKHTHKKKSEEKRRWQEWKAREMQKRKSKRNPSPSLDTGYQRNYP